MFVGIVHRKALPVAALAQIRKNAGGILMEMEERSARDIEYARPPLDEGGPGSEARKQIVQSLQCDGTGVLHRAR